MLGEAEYQRQHSRFEDEYHLGRVAPMDEPTPCGKKIGDCTVEDLELCELWFEEREDFYGHEAKKARLKITRKQGKATRGPRRCTESELNRVGVTIANPSRGTLECLECERQWWVNYPGRSGRRAPGYWKCPGGCNDGE